MAEEGERERGGWSRSLASLRERLNPSAVEEPEPSCCPALTFKQRLIGFGFCYLVGFLISMLSFGSFSRMLAGEPVDFAVKYTVGNVLSICATAFLVGPARQLRNMTASTRLAASCIYIGSLLLTVVLCFVFPIAPLIIISIIVQWGALSWYCLSYIPYARRAARGLFNSIVDV